MNERHIGVRDTIKNYLYFGIDVIIYTTKEFEEVKLMYEYWQRSCKHQKTNVCKSLRNGLKN
jgi:hypothetical protein